MAGTASNDVFGLKGKGQGQSTHACSAEHITPPTRRWLLTGEILGDSGGGLLHWRSPWRPSQRAGAPASTGGLFPVLHVVCRRVTRLCPYQYQYQYRILHLGEVLVRYARFRRRLGQCRRGYASRQRPTQFLEYEPLIAHWFVHWLAFCIIPVPVPVLSLRAGGRASEERRGSTAGQKQTRAERRQPG